MANQIFSFALEIVKQMVLNPFVIIKVYPDIIDSGKKKACNTFDII